MLIIILLTTVFMIIAYYDSITDEELEANLIGAIIGGIFFGALIALILPVQTERVTKTYELKSFKLNEKQEQKKFLNINNNDYQFCYRKDNHYKLKTKNKNKASINFILNKRPFVKIKEKKHSDCFVNNFITLPLKNHRKTKYILYIPEQSINK